MVKKTKGFTLIELLVVISIIALLVSILMPALSKARQNAKFLICKTRQRSIVQAVNLFQAENDGDLPPSTQGRTNGWQTIPMRLKYYYGMDGANGGSVIDVLGTYMKNVDVFDCPLAKHNPDWQKKYFHSMKNDSVQFMNCSYYLLWNWTKCEDAGPNGRKGFKPTKSGKDGLMVCDFLIYNESVNNGAHNGTFWISPHPWKNASLKTFMDASGTLDDGFKFWMADDPSGQDKPQMQMAAGYIDGRVDTVHSDDYEYVSTGGYLLPKVLK
ncbi:MAG: type II secretion system protein [Phycisphaerae bacterium]|nr:type II secretion system protein [Phycisphaerae bacterium]